MLNERPLKPARIIQGRWIAPLFRATSRDSGETRPPVLAHNYFEPLSPERPYNRQSCSLIAVSYQDGHLTESLG